MIGIKLSHTASEIDANLALAETAAQPAADLAGFTSSTATAGQVPTADGTGGVSWSDPTGGDLSVAFAIVFGA